MKKPHERTYRLNMRRLMAAWYLSFSHALPPLSAGLKVHAFSAYASCGRPRQQKDRGYRARRRLSGGLDTRRASKARLELPWERTPASATGTLTSYPNWARHKQKPRAPLAQREGLGANCWRADSGVHAASLCADN